MTLYIELSSLHPPWGASCMMTMECPRIWKCLLNVALQQAMNPADSNNFTAALQVQGESFRSDAVSLDIWSMVIQSVLDVIMKFFMNTILDTLPHRQNLMKWERYSAQPALCAVDSKLCYMFWTTVTWRCARGAMIKDTTLYCSTLWISLKHTFLVGL